MGATNAQSRSPVSFAREEILSALHSRFGMKEFRPGQEEIIRKVLSGRNVLAILPAGYGKSLLYQLPASLLSGRTLVFSPLISLMHDQEAALNRRFGVPSISLTHLLVESNPRRFWGAVAAIRRGEYKVIFVAPERLDDDRVMEAIRSQPISLVVLDEAHCISLWGHDFRPHYRRVLRFAAEVRPAPVLALTATAPQAVSSDIMRQLHGETSVHRVSPYRANLDLHVIPVAGEADKLSCLVRILPRLEGNGIVYCGTHEECENVAEFLNAGGIDSTFYHAGLGKQRREIERGFLDNNWKVVAATCALGMGIDKRDLRFVIHYRFSGSPELYYQEIGRAGRDGRRARCILFFDPRDRTLQEFFLRQSHPDPVDYGLVYNHLDLVEPLTADALAGETGLPLSLVEVVLENLVEAGLAKRAKRAGNGPREPQFLQSQGDPSKAAIEPFLEARRARAKALEIMVGYSQTTRCLMQYLCDYLGFSESRSCGRCTNCRGLAEKYAHYRKPAAGVDEFLITRYPRIESCGEHSGGYVLDFHAGTEVGEVLSRSKYGRDGVVPDWIVERAAECIQKKYLALSSSAVGALAFIPANSDRRLVEDFVCRLGARLRIPYVDILVRARQVELQKDMKTPAEKRRNITGAFAVAEGARLPAQSILLVDDIYDSGWTFREAARVLHRAFPECRIRVFALTRTHRSGKN